jgi:SAM-dependent methyltransferase
MLLAALGFSVMGGAAKALKGNVSAGQLVFYRNAVGLLFLLHGIFIRPPVQEGGKPFGLPNKHKVFSEIDRVLKPGGHFSISDIVLEGPLPQKWKEVAELYAGCVSGAIQKKKYLDIIEEAGFKNIALQKDKTIDIPDDILANYLTTEEIAEYKSGATRITSITVYAEKPAKDDRICCDPGSGYC